MAGDETKPSAPVASPSPQERLDSWKEIAAYLRRDVRTVRRWEANARLPIHRHPHAQRSSVYAWKSEIDEWWEQGPERVAAEAGAGRRWWRLGWVFALVVLALSLGYAGFRRMRPAAPPLTRRIAVLPFENLTGNPDHQYLSDGFTEELITELGRSQASGLIVIGRTSSQQYRNAKKGIGQIGRELQVDYVLEGSVRSGGGRLRIAAQLIRVTDEAHVWAESYDRELHDVLSLQSEISEAVARQIQIRMPPASAPAARRVQPEAYEAYLKALYILRRRAGGRNDAYHLLEEAIAKDPGFAAAHAALATTFMRIAAFGPEPRAEAWQRAEAAAMRALELDRSLSSAHTALAGIYQRRDWNFAAADRENLTAIALNPSDPDAHSSRAAQFRALGLSEVAIMERKCALALDPVRVDLIEQLGTEYVYAREFTLAAEQFRRALQLDPTYRIAIQGLADAYERSGLYGAAAAEQVRVLLIKGQAGLASDFQRVYRELGYPAAQRLLDEDTLATYRALPEERNSWNVAFSYARLGNRDAAFLWLEKAYEYRDPGLLMIRSDPDLDSLRGDPRFGLLVARMPFPR